MDDIDKEISFPQEKKKELSDGAVSESSMLDSKTESLEDSVKSIKEVRQSLQED